MKFLVHKSERIFFRLASNNCPQALEMHVYRLNVRNVDISELAST